MARLEPGSTAPDIALRTDEDEGLTLSSLRGERVVLYFYPRSDTPGCTTEACEFRDASADFAGAGARILGVSPDPVAKQARFRAKHELPFTILSDPDHVAAEAYGVWVEKRNYGKTYMGVERSTFVIGADGTIEKAMYKVRPAGHAAAVLQALAEG